MPRMIDADALVEYFEGLARSLANARYFNSADAIKGAAEKVTAATTIDAEPVVRCKDCKFFCPYEDEEYKGDCAELVGLESCVYAYDYCSYGERKGE